MVPLNLPNFLTLLRILAVPVVVVALLDGTPNGDMLAAVVFEALTTRHPRACYSVRPDWSRTLLSALPERLIDPVLKLALALLARPAGKAS